MPTEPDIFDKIKTGHYAPQMVKTADGTEYRHTRTAEFRADLRAYGDAFLGVTLTDEQFNQLLDEAKSKTMFPNLLELAYAFDRLLHIVQYFLPTEVQEEAKT